MSLQRHEVIALVAASILLMTAGAAWLWGPIVLMVVGAVLLGLAFFVDF